MLEGHKILITGGSGFIGSYLCERLVEHNKVIVYDNGHRDALRHTGLTEHPNLKVIKGDVLDLDRLKEAADRCDIIIHCAAIAGIDSVCKRPIVTMKVNLIGTYNALEAAVRNRVDRFVYFSTSEVYGPLVYKGSENSLTTQGEVGKMRWVYSSAKLAGEHMTFCYAEEYHMKFVIIRPFNVYGPRQVGESAIVKFIQQAVNNQKITIYGDGSQIRAWCFIDDFVDGVMTCLEKPEAVNRIFNLGNPRETISVGKLADEIIRLTGSRSTICFEPSDQPDVEVRVPSIANARKILGFNPVVGLTEGVLKTVEWVRQVQGERK